MTLPALTATHTRSQEVHVWK